MRRADRSPGILVVTLAGAAAGASSVLWWLGNGRSPAAKVALFLSLVSAVLAIALSVRAFLRRKEASPAPSLSPHGVTDELCQLIEAAHAVAWDRDVKAGTHVVFGDLQATFGVAGRSHAGTFEEFRERVHPDDRERVWVTVREAQANRTRYRATYRVVMHDGTVRWHDSSGQFYYDANGEAVRMLGIATDVTERRLLEQTLDGSRTMLAEVLASATDAILVLDEERRITLFNTAAERLFGYPVTEVQGAAVARFLSATQDGWSPPRLPAGAPAGHCGGTVNRWWASPNGGDPFPVEVSLSETTIEGGQRYLLIVRDLRERLRVENALREGEERFRLIADSAPMLLWVSGLDKHCTYVNRAWLQFTGRTLEQELGSGWAESVLPEHYQRCLETYERAFDKREPFTFECQLRRHDGQYRWMLASGVPRSGPGSAFAGYIGSAADITDLKSARGLLADFGQRLLQAHETERARIARDLHDDIGQRMAVLTMDLDTVAATIPASNAEASRRLRALSTRAIDLARDIQALSHRLHSSKLDHLGLVSASAGLCRELSAQHSVTVAFSAVGVPDDVPKNVALGVFRVLQEAVNNALKHGQSEIVHAALYGTAAGIQLDVVDGGAGFDVAAAMHNGGLGLISMHERVSLLNGQLQVESRHGSGTRVHATFPLADSPSASSAAIN
jgi:PAS domain S-box-containing protein